MPENSNSDKWMLLLKWFNVILIFIIAAGSLIKYFYARNVVDFPAGATVAVCVIAVILAITAVLGLFIPKKWYLTLGITEIVLAIALQAIPVLLMHGVIEKMN